MQGLDAFNIVLVGANFSVERIQLSDFSFGGLEPEIEFRIPQALQVSAGEYFLQVLPGRFQVGVNSSQATPARLRILTDACLAFIEGYTTKRGVIAIGHNFSGNLESSIGAADDFMRYIAWREDFAAAVGDDPGSRLSLAVKSDQRPNDERSRTIRLEPLTTDNAKLFYDLNYNWGDVETPLRTPAADVVESFSESLKLGTELIDKIAAIGQISRGGDDDS